MLVDCSGFIEKKDTGNTDVCQIWDMHLYSIMVLKRSLILFVM